MNTNGISQLQVNDLLGKTKLTHTSIKALSFTKESTYKCICGSEMTPLHVVSSYINHKI